MAETQRIFSPLLSPPSRLRSARRPRLPHPPPRSNAPLRVPLEEVPIPPPPEVAARLLPAEGPHVGGERREATPRFPPRTRAERVLMAVLLSGLGLTAVVLVTNPALTPSDFLLGTTVLAAGIALLMLMELCRRTCPPRR